MAGTTTVKYIGSADEYHLVSADLKKAGLEGGKATKFRKDEPVEVPADVAKVLLEHELFAGSFAPGEAVPPAEA